MNTDQPKMLVGRCFLMHLYLFSFSSPIIVSTSAFEKLDSVPPRMTVESQYLLVTCFKYHTVFIFNISLIYHCNGTLKL